MATDIAASVRAGGARNRRRAVRLSGADRIAVAFLAVPLEFDSQPMVIGLGVVSQQDRAIGVVSKNQIRLAVVVEIGACQATTKALLVKVGAGLMGHFAKTGIALAQE